MLWTFSFQSSKNTKLIIFQKFSPRPLLLYNDTSRYEFVQIKILITIWINYSWLSRSKNTAAIKQKNSFNDFDPLRLSSNIHLLYLFVQWIFTIKFITFSISINQFHNINWYRIQASFSNKFNLYFQTVILLPV